MEADKVQDSQKLLQWMARKPDEVLEALDPAERRSVLAELHALADQAARVQSEEDLSRLSDAVHRIFARMPALLQEIDAAEPQSQPTRRKITFDYDEAAYRKSRYAQERAAQIRNSVVECRLRLERALRESS